VRSLLPLPAFASESQEKSANSALSKRKQMVEEFQFLVKKLATHVPDKFVFSCKTRAEAC